MCFKTIHSFIFKGCDPYYEVRLPNVKGVNVKCTNGTTWTTLHQIICTSIALQIDNNIMTYNLAELVFLFLSM